MLKALSSTSADLLIHDRWVMDLAITDDSGYLPSAEPVITLQLSQPDNDQPDPFPEVEKLSSGVYRFVLEVSESGRYVAVVLVDGYGTLGFTAFVQSITPAGNMPTPTDVRDYADDSENIGEWEDADIQAVLDSEASQQRARLDIGAVFTPDLFEALVRRTVLALNRRSKLNAGDFSTGVLNGESQAFIPNDPEIRRLEAPYKKVVLI